MKKRFFVSHSPYRVSLWAEDGRVRSGVSLLSLGAFLGVQWMPGVFVLQAAQAQQRVIQPPAPAWAGNRVSGPQGSKPGRIKPSEPTACAGAECEVSMKALDLSRVPREKELRMAGQLGGALSPTKEADVPRLKDKLHKELLAAGVAGGLESQAPPDTAEGQMVLKARKKIKDLEGANLAFGAAMQEWNKHNFRNAAKLFKEQMKEYPDSPWAGEVTLHLGCDAKYNGRFAESQSIYDSIVKSSSSDPKDPSFDINQKAKARWADLDLALGRLDEASAKLQNLLKTDTDWRRRTWYSSWLINLDLFKKNAKDLRACGSQALSVVLASTTVNRKDAAMQLAKLRPPREAGFSLSEMAQMAKKHGVEMKGFKATTPAALAQIPTPFIIHYDFHHNKAEASVRMTSTSVGTQSTLKAGAKATGKAVKATVPSTKYKLAYRQAWPDEASFEAAKAEEAALYSVKAGSPGHYLVVRRVNASQGTLSLYDPLQKRTYYLGFDDLKREWSGKGLMLAKAASKVRATKVLSSGAETSAAPRLAWLDEGEMRRTFGGCCGHFTASPNKGCNSANQDGDGSGCGSNGGCESKDGKSDPGRDLGDPRRPGRGGGDNNTTEKRGSPVVSVNRASLNIYVSDTPLWYTPAIGPRVEITLSYNSQDSLTQANPFGNKWMFNYGSYVVEDTGAGGGVVTVFMADGSQDSYTPDASGNYIAPQGVFNTLRKLSATRYEIENQTGDKAIYDIPAGTTSLQPFLIELRDRWSKSLTFGYNANVQLTTITDAQGRVTELQYGPDGRVGRVNDPFGRHAKFLYDTNGNLVECVDMEGHAFQYTYDWNVNLTELNTAQGPWKMANVYGNYWQGLQLTDPAGKSETWGYSGYANYSYTDKRGIYWGYNVGYVAGGEPKITEIRNPDGTSTGTSYDYNTGLPNAFRDARGKTVQITFNAKGQSTSIIDKKGHITTLNYAPNGIDVTSIVNARNETVVSYTYNTRYQPLSVTDATGRTTSLTYTSWGAPLTATDSDGTTDFVYNNQGQRTSITRGGSTLANMTYDHIGRVRTRTDAGGQMLSYEYNNLDHVTKIGFEDGTSIEYDYVCCGLVGVVKDRSGRRSYYDYDPMRRLTRSQDSSGRSVFFDYDAEGRRIQLLDSKIQETRWSYDNMGRLSKKTYADGRFESWRYDVANNSVDHINAAGKVTTLNYDDNGNLTLVDYPTMPDVTIAYNELDKPISMTDGLGTTTLGYDGAHRLQGMDGPFENDTITYGYNALGQRNAMNLPGFATSYAYDTLGRLDSVTSPAGTFDYGYVSNTGKLSQLALPNGATTNYSYDGLNRLTQTQSLTNTNANISRYAYGYDNVTHRAGRTQEVSQVEAEDPITRAYGYDGVDQVTSEVLSQAGVTLQETSYGFDPMGNRNQTQSTSTAGQSTSSYSHNRLNQTTGLSTTTAQGTAQSTLSYDDEGNLLHVGSTAQSGTFYSYDDANQLSQIVNRDAAGEPTSKSTFLYDGLKRLRVSREFAWQNGAWVQTGEVRRVYDGMNVVQERDAQNNVLTTYTRGLDMSGGIGGLLARTDGNGSLFYHYDGRGNVTQLTNSTQQVVAKYGYDAFGNTSASGTAAGLNRYRFSTKEQIGGLYCYGYRFYSASLGRWINRDPIGESGGVNLYGFVENNSTNKADVYGMFPWWLEGVLAGIAVAAEAAMGFCGSLMCRENCETCCHIALAVYGAALFAAYMVAIVGCGVMVVAPPVAGACVALATLVYAGTLWNMANDYQGCLNSCRNKPSRGTPPCCP